MKTIKRGDIFWAHMGKSDDHEQRGTRPVLILQNNTGNQFSPTVIVACITDGHKKPLPTHIHITAVETGIKKDSIILLEQIRTLDKGRLSDFVTHLSEWVMADVNEKLMISIGLTEVRGGAKPRPIQQTANGRTQATQRALY